MAWEQLSINRPHLAYAILGGFTSLFMLVSLFVKERLYIGEATVATICGIIFGPHAANLFDPSSWGNADQITLECSRIVLVVQCFAIGVELPREYMEKHWKSVVYLLVPVMSFGWLITSLFIWWMVVPLTWIESLACAACVTATDPVLASSVVGKGTFAKRVPRHLRDLLSAESGCNDGMAFPFIYFALYQIQYRPDASEVSLHWFCNTILYECVFGAVYGVIIGYCGRHAIKWAERHDLIDRESFLVFYFTLALFCAGTGSLLGMDDLLVGFAAGVGFSNDGWFQAKTEESHVSNVIDLLLNLAYFVFFGAIIPWEQFNAPEIGLTPWRLVVIAIFVILFRRIPIMLALKPIVPDIKTWREAVFAGHFGPIGVGAIFIAILARAELETKSTVPLAQIPAPGTPNYNVIALIWPITTFLVISSILVHGSSIAVFTLGKHINTLTITMSYTQANEDGPSWMNRLPRIASQSKGSMSRGKPDVEDSESSNEKLPEFPPGTLPPTGFPGNFLRRQREEDDGTPQGSRPSSIRAPMRKKKWDAGVGPGGPISQSAIAPRRRDLAGKPQDDHPTNEQSEGQMLGEGEKGPDGVEVYQEGNETVLENEQGDVVDIEKNDEPNLAEKGEHVLEEAKDDVEHPSHPYKNLKKRLGAWDWHRHKDGEGSQKPAEQKRGPAMAYQIGNTIIVEDEDGEVVKKYDLPSAKRPENAERKGSFMPNQRQRLQRMGTMMGAGKKDNGEGPESAQKKIDADDDRIRFVQGGRRMSKADFLEQLRQLDPKSRAVAVNESNAPPDIKTEARKQVPGAAESSPSSSAPQMDEVPGSSAPQVKKVASHEDGPKGPEGLTLIDSNEDEIPFHSVGTELEKHSKGTAAQRRRQAAMASADDDSDDDGTDRIPPHVVRGGPVGGGEGETAAERKRREAALGVGRGESDSDESDSPRQTKRAVQEPPRIRFADQPPKERE
ncbi:MAG: hypothetical protein M1817_005794 [Caeruleum heppii]|nr:MAG: hypothetical protein M1817_005794 [Caeruleum heppii]